MQTPGDAFEQLRRIFPGAFLDGKGDVYFIPVLRAEQKTVLRRWPDLVVRSDLHLRRHQEQKTEDENKTTDFSFHFTNPLIGPKLFHTQPDRTEAQTNRRS